MYNRKFKADQNTTLMLTRHARRIYAGGIPPRATESEIQVFFDDIVSKALAPVKLNNPPVSKVYLNVEKCYAFVEFNSIELTTACMQLDGVKFDHYSGSTVIRVRRPNDYRPETLPLGSVGPTPVLNLGVLGGMGSTGNGGPGKIFVGGLPYNLADEQIMELLAAFGPIKQFHQVREPGSLTSKGYAFCEYLDPSVAEAAINGLNGLQLGEKTLSVRIASAANNANQTVSSAMGNLTAYGTNRIIQGFDTAHVQPTRILQLSNMVTREDLQSDTEVADIKEDVRLECADHGSVLQVLIPRVRDGHNVSSEGLIFVEFYDSSMATSAALVLNGRKFADKTVVVNYVSFCGFYCFCS
jgi:splicing factor U2AF subunit